MSNSLHRVLLQRLVVTTVLIALVMVGIVYLSERDRVTTLAADRMAQRAEQLNLRVQDVLDSPQPWDPAPFEAFAEELWRWRVKDRWGNFVIGGVYDGQGGSLAELTAGGADLTEPLRHFYREQGRRLPAAGSMVQEVIREDGRPHVFAAIPLTDSAGRAVAVMQGIFAVSDTALSHLRLRMLRTMLAVVGIVLVTASLLYPVILTLLKKLQRFSTDLMDANLETLKILGEAVAKRDSDTDAHNYRVTLLAVSIAEHMGLSRSQLQGLIKGAFLHDVGKIAISDNVLLKPGRLDDAEFQVMKTHVDHGVDMVSKTPWLGDAVDVVGSHHEKYDGSGYPKGIDMQDIPQTARIFAVADVFDALTSKRPYKTAYSLEDSLGILAEGKGTHFDPAVIDAFMAIAAEQYQRLSGREDEGLRHELDSVIRNYFDAGQDSLAG